MTGRVPQGRSHPVGRFGAYRVDHELEPGSLGRRFHATAGRIEVVLETVSIRGDSELFERALRRIEVMAASNHDHLVPILDAGLDRDHVFVATPVPDRTADRAGVVGLAALEVIAPAGRGLAHLHETGARHRDIQLRHIGWYDGVVKLGGLGLSAVDGTDRTHGVGPIGSVLTMAPSIVRGAPATVGSDLYGLGASLHLLATGVAVHPVRVESLVNRICRIGHEAPTIHPSLPRELTTLVEGALGADRLGDDAASTSMLLNLSHPQRSKS